jgi:hypothetical protein
MTKPKCVTLAERNLALAASNRKCAEDALAAAIANERQARSALIDSKWSPEAALWRAKNSIWLDASGVEYQYKDLTDIHLNNILGMFRSYRHTDHPAEQGLKAEAEKRGLK